MKIEIAGERGTAALEDDRIVKWEFAEAHPNDEAARADAKSIIGGGAADPKAIGGEGHRLLVGDLVEAIRTGRPPLIDSREARNAVAIIQAIYRSAKAGVAVPVV
jgi:predicted dehydrogenase